MKLTSTWKFIIMAFIVAVNVLSWIWVGIETDALALNLNVHVYNIVSIVITALVTAGSGVLTYLGLRNPVEPPDVEFDGEP